ncbi:hypothetical protein D9O40_00620 [Clostridium autoethanogenum]|uniref:DUF3990 domain-containing protein n=1 Tax=Clostridium autoethanogenum TaxID=84023 RepID=A0A3M0T2K9_9CLOT|nr:hypothetical protein [Clostridium autoethanogenum]RMD04889.1 hypothetical protein D9O40_00620 [Clostridium autoethanogenum]
MNSKKLVFDAYHGTDYNAEKCITKYKKYKVSNKDNEWLGTGIYFFIDKDKQKAIENAYKWAVNFKHFKYYAVLRSLILVDEDKIINFNDEDWQEIYHKYREGKINETINRGLTIETDRIKFDCQVINEMCKKFGILAIYQQRYIDLLEKRGLPKSEIPNCTILCVRRNELIDKSSIKVEERGCSN